jgi:hypothetical protein
VRNCFERETGKVKPVEIYSESQTWKMSELKSCYNKSAEKKGRTIQTVRSRRELK